MSVTTHAYAAVLLGSPNVNLPIKGGACTLDAGWSPHVQSTLTIPMPSLATLAQLDPRLTKRVRIDAISTGALGNQNRTFDLALRDREVSLADATVTIALASDEALLGDYAPLADDATPLSYQNSLRTLINYVLGKVITGAALAASADVAVPALADAENLVRNPRRVGTWDWQSSTSAGTLATGGYTTGGPSYAPSYYFMGAATGAVTGAVHYIDESATALAGDQNYVETVDVRFDAGLQVQIDAVLFDASGFVVGFATPTIVNGVTGTWQRKVVKFYAPPTAVRVRPRVLVIGSLPNGKYIDITAWRLSRDTGDPTDLGYFDGGTAGTAAYSYSWASGAHASNSMRKTLQDAATPDALTWKAGQTALDFLLPIVQRFGLRLVCDETRTWTLRDENYTASDDLNIRYAVNLILGGDTISRQDETWFDAAVVRYTWRDREGRQRTALDAYALNTPHTRLRLIERNTPYPGPGFAQYAVRRAQGRGREVNATTISDWRARPEQPVVIILDGAPTQTGKTGRVTFDFDRDELTVTARTTDTPAGAIDLKTGTINALAGNINAQ